jgi:UDP-N-acetylglucosamine 4,6-dehydratase/5-epimerase
MDLSKANIFVTGGAGTLGRAIARRRKQEGWTGKFTVYSTDEHKHAFMRNLYPDVNFIQGDIRNSETLYAAMAGHEVVVHAAAVKVIPVSEWQSLDTFDVNVAGSQIVCATALRAQVDHLLGISTDKACHPANAYGCTKMMMEKVFQEYARIPNQKTQFHLVRYGNVLESTGSVIEAWHKAVAEGKPIKMTDPNMTRFWLSPSQAVQYVIEALQYGSGLIYIPLMPALSIGDLASYVLGAKPIEIIPLRPGEKMHETLLTGEEGYYVENPLHETFHLLRSTTTFRNQPELNEVSVPMAYSSDVAPDLTIEELRELLKND